MSDLHDSRPSSASHSTNGHSASVEIFERNRPRLWRLAYRMLGSKADADDAVQDTFLRWMAAAGEQIENPEGWLTTACTRRSIDPLRAAHRSRVDYVGPWLPEPLLEMQGPEPPETVEMASSLATAFLLLLERLTPAERAAFLLHDVFDYDYEDVSAALDKSRDACRKLVSRARKSVGGEHTRFVTEPDQQQRLLGEFLEALQTGAVGTLESLLAKDAELWADGGGKVPAVSHVVRGAEDVAQFLETLWQTIWHRYEIVPADVNGGAGLILRDSGTTVAIVSLSATDDSRIAGIFVVRNPDKLGREAHERLS